MCPEVFDNDSFNDKLEGKKGLDWFLANNDDDIKDLHLDEILTLTDLIV